MAYVITDTGLAMTSSIMQGNSISYYVSSGANPSQLTAAATDVALFQEIAQRALATTSSTTTNTTYDTLTVVGTVTATSDINIREVGVTDSYTQPGTSTVNAASTVIGSSSGIRVVTNTVLNLSNTAYIQIRGEVMQVTSGAGTNTLTVVRGRNNTTPITTIATNDPIAIGNIPGVATTTGGNLFSKADVSLIGLSTGDAITYTWNYVYQ